ncbi:DnaB-like helicase C-terminal domain-containing protein [Loigolactobacillus backii]|uniref:DnaB-like helicase C-terminal domain-containing protein n=1 Tax=Loigolactobacillus backii TaxID=375175 RepID=UPI0007F121BD|nr:DnaB-like helicase C-terminal domain-containing protein [Loigolactobacillus backii]ANK59844.1 hypothetical protein AYR52_05960 [Loigolactobacillus backii]
MNQPTIKIDDMPLERSIIATLINSPGLIKLGKIEAEWFAPNYRNIVKTLIQENGDFSGSAEFVSKFNFQHGGEISNDTWDAILQYDFSQNEHVSQLYEADIILMRNQHQRIEAASAAFDYASDPNTNNLDRLKKQLDMVNNKISKPHKSMSQLYDEMKTKLYSDTPEGIKTYSNLDDALNGGIRGNNLFVIGARPAVGKSAFSANLAIQSLRSDPKLKLDIFSLEMGDSEIYDRIGAMISAIPARKFYNANKQMNEKEKLKVLASMKFLNDNRLTIYKNIESSGEIAGTIRQRAADCQSGHYMAIVDYLQLVHSDSKSDTRSTEVGSITRELKKATQELDIPIVLLSQLNRASQQRQSNDLADLRESGSIEQDANKVAFLSNVDDQANDDNFQVVCLDIKKNREGKLTKLYFNFYKDTQKFAERF